MYLPFTKYQGTGNDFIMLDNRSAQWEQHLTQAQIDWLCDRRFGIGADGLIMLSPDPTLDFRMIYFNADGSESTMCGNGGRCIVAFAHALDVIGTQTRFRAIDGPHEARIEDGRVSLRMGQPVGQRQLLEPNFTWINTGSPHLVIPAGHRWDRLEVMQEGAHWRHHAEFTEIGGTNVNFVRPISEDQLEVRTFERGVEAETFSCGTGVTACAYLHHVQTGAKLIDLKTLGGPLQVRIEADEAGLEGIWLIGPAQHVFSGQVELSL